MLRRLSLRDVVIVSQLEVELNAGFSVLTGETGAGKSILIDALQLALGGRGDAVLVREGCARAEVSAEFDTPPPLTAWLDEAGFDNGGDTLLLRRSVDAQGKSRAWINGSPATVGQLREAGEQLVDIHGQHAWQSLTRPAAVRALLDQQAGADTAVLATLWQAWKTAEAALADARARGETLERERERLAWQIGEVDKLAPADGEWDELNAEHQRLAHAQSLLDGVRAALGALSDGEPAADGLAGQAIDALEDLTRYDASLATVLEVLQGAQAQLQDAAHSLHAYLGRSEPDPARLAELDARLSNWLSLARRYRRAPAELPALLAGWKHELKAVDAATDLAALEASQQQAQSAWRVEAQRVGKLRRAAAPKLSTAVTQAMQQLGMAGGRFEVVLTPVEVPQAFGLESAEFLVAGHAGSSPRPLAKVASGGELSRLALAIAVTTSRAASDAQGAAAPTLIFDEIDAGVGGSVAYQVGRMMKQLGGSSQVLAVTHLAQVAACADHHFVVSKSMQGRATVSEVHPVAGEARVSEVARMLGGERLAGTSRAHAEAMLGGAGEADESVDRKPARSAHKQR
ncbi:MAG: DNA repair protein RecN [Burkholderiaceae bacterium]|jgi:DNA repair protein RecN (Recombination protein N)|nr:DNA repair protein RecN [Burkholderiaceae bacterium]